MADFIDINAGSGASPAEIADAVVSDPALAVLIDERLTAALTSKFPGLQSASVTVDASSGAVAIAAGPGQRVEVYGFEFRTDVGYAAFSLFSGDDLVGDLLASYIIPPIVIPEFEGLAYAMPFTWTHQTVPRFTTNPGQGLFINNGGVSTLAAFLIYRTVE